MVFIYPPPGSNEPSVWYGIADSKSNLQASDDYSLNYLVLLYFTEKYL